MTQVLQERFDSLTEIGRGGMGTVYRGEDKLLQRAVAIKVLRSLQTSKADAERFAREAKALSLLNHANIVKVYAFGLDDQRRPYYVYELLAGSPLSNVLSSGKTFSKEEKLEIIRSMCKALDHAHSHGVVHRDLKPSNIFICDDGTVKLIDFGIATFLPDSNEEWKRLTQTGAIIGTPLYISPEQCTGAPVDQRSDIYSLGCIITELFTGKLPFSGESPMEIMLKRLSAEPSRWTSAGLDQISTIASRCLERDASKRFQTMAEVLAALSDPHFDKTPIRYRFRRTMHPALSMVAFVGLLLLIVAIMAAIKARQETESRRAYERDLSQDMVKAEGYAAHNQWNLAAESLSKSLQSPNPPAELLIKHAYYVSRVGNTNGREWTQLHTDLQKAISELLRNDPHNLLSDAYMTLGNVDYFDHDRSKYAEEEFLASIKSNHNWPAKYAGIESCCNSIGAICKEKNNYEEGLQIFRSTIEQYKSQADVRGGLLQRAREYRQMWIPHNAEEKKKEEDLSACFARGKLKEDTAERLVKHGEYKAACDYCRKNAADVKQTFGAYSMEYQHFIEMWEMASRCTGDDKSTVEVGNERRDLLKQIEDLIHKSYPIDSSYEKGIDESIATADLWVGESYLQLNDLSKAHAYLDESLRFTTKVGTPHSYALWTELTYQRGICELALKHKESGIRLLIEAQKLAQTAGLKDVENAAANKIQQARLH